VAGHFDLTGTIDSTGDFALSGSATVSFGPVSGPVHLDVTRRQGAVNFAGTAHFDTPVGGVDVALSVTPDGGFRFSGAADVSLEGAARGNLTLTVTRPASGDVAVTAAGRLFTPAGTFDVSGDFLPNGDFTLTGQNAVQLAGTAGTGTLTVSRRDGVVNVSLTGPQFTTPVGNFDVSGFINPDGTFDLTGTAGLSFGAVAGDGTLHLRNGGGQVVAHLDGTFASPLGGFVLQGDLLPGDDFLLSGQAVVPFGPLTGAATLTVSRSNGVLQVLADADVNTTAGPVSVHGDVDPAGNFQLSGSADLAFGPASGTGTLTVGKQGSAVTAHLAAHLVTAVGAFDVSGDYQPNGDLTLTGSGVLDSGPLTGTGTLTVAAASGRVTAHLDAHLTTPVGDFDLGGDLAANGDFRSDGQLSASALVRVPGLAAATLRGQFGAGGWRLTGAANLQLGGFTLANSSLTLTNGGLAVSDTLAIPGLGTFALSGTVSSNGNVSLSGRSTGAVTLGPITLAAGNGSLTLTRVGSAVTAHFTGTFSTPLGAFAVAGDLGANGSFTLTGNGRVNFGSVLDNNARLSVTRTASGAVTVGVHLSSGFSVGGSAGGLSGNLTLDLTLGGTPGNPSFSGGGSATGTLHAGPVNVSVSVGVHVEARRVGLTFHAGLIDVTYFIDLP
jgi:hypothetical protein